MLPNGHNLNQYILCIGLGYFFFPILKKQNRKDVKNENKEIGIMYYIVI